MIYRDALERIQETAIRDENAGLVALCSAALGSVLANVPKNIVGEFAEIMKRSALLGTRRAGAPEAMQ